jgi:enoyl-[acyl-carrier-protein] reductase (NADH)
MTLLAGKKGLIIGIANRDSIAWACAQAMHAAGAAIGATWPHAHEIGRAAGGGRVCWTG